MTTNSGESGGIRAKRIEAESVVSGVQIQGADTQSATSLVQLARLFGEETFRLMKSRLTTLSAGYSILPSDASKCGRFPARTDSFTRTS